jgi:RNA polymerase sigma factor (sigma-70 family)
MVRPDDDFTRLVDRTVAAVSRYALRRALTPADAEDVVAETYAVAWKKRGEIPAGEAELAWLYAVARRVLANRTRGGRRWDRLRIKVGGQRSTTPAPAAPDAVADHADVRAALAHLPEADAELLRLLAWEQLSQAEAAAVLGLSENAVALRASRARKKLRSLLDDRSDAEVDMEGRATERRSDAV